MFFALGNLIPFVQILHLFCLAPIGSHLMCCSLLHPSHLYFGYVHVVGSAQKHSALLYTILMASPTCFISFSTLTSNVNSFLPGFVAIILSDASMLSSSTTHLLLCASSCIFAIVLSLKLSLFEFRNWQKVVILRSSFMSAKFAIPNPRSAVGRCIILVLSDDVVSHFLTAFHTCLPNLFTSFLPILPCIR